MAKLWKDTFHDSDQYVSLVFSNYFNPDLVEFEENDGEVVAAMLGVPYRFVNASNSIKALYLCGLATKTQFRSRGIMTRLLAKMNDKARNAGFAFTFLIPSDPGLRKYYRDRGFVNAFYRVIDNYTSLHDFNLEFNAILAEQKEKVAVLKKRYFDSLKCSVINSSTPVDTQTISSLVALIRSIEDNQQDLQIIHSDRDIEILIRENALSGGSIVYSYNSSDQITAVAFVTVSDAEANIHKLFSTDLASKYKVMSAVKEKFADLPIRHYVSSIEMDRNAVWARSYGSFMGETMAVGTISVTERVYSLAAHAKVYGMAHILDLYEILKFQAGNRHDLKYSILMKSSDVYTLEQIDTLNGEVKVRKLPVDSVDSAKMAYLMSKRDISEILFRRRDTDNMITEAFGIPSINGAINLMLD